MCSLEPIHKLQSSAKNKTKQKDQLTKGAQMSSRLWHVYFFGAFCVPDLTTATYSYLCHSNGFRL